MQPCAHLRGVALSLQFAAICICNVHCQQARGATCCAASRFGDLTRLAELDSDSETDAERSSELCSPQSRFLPDTVNFIVTLRVGCLHVVSASRLRVRVASLNCAFDRSRNLESSVMKTVAATTELLLAYLAWC